MPAITVTEVAKYNRIFFFNNFITHILLSVRFFLAL